MAVPKKRKSRSRSRHRRAQHDKITVTQDSVCPNCEEPKLPHHLCTSCGFYKGKSVLEVVEY